MKRIAYMSVIKDNCESGLREYFRSFNNPFANDIMTLSAYIFENILYVYYECINNDISPNEIFNGASQYLMDMPNEKEGCFSLMFDIFHYNKPRDEQHWARKSKPQICYARVAKLKPEKLASYIYYHYQAQEELSDVGNKYGIIFLNGNTLFFYSENPRIAEKQWYKGSLSTRSSPKKEEWMPIMMTHFELWNNGEPWREIENLITVGQSISIS